MTTDAELRCESCLLCENGCESAPTNKVNSCPDYERKLSDILKDTEVNTINHQSLCSTCLMEEHCALPKGINEIVDQCCYYTPKLGDMTLQHIAEKIVTNAKPKICQTCMFKGRSCIPNRGEDCSEWKRKENPLTEDCVNHPSHYTQGGIECIKCIEASMKPEGFQDYCKGNVIKYIHRWREKGGVEDLKKAEVYLKWLIESAENGRIA